VHTEEVGEVIGTGRYGTLIDVRYGDGTVCRQSAEEVSLEEPESVPPIMTVPALAREVREARPGLSAAFVHTGGGIWCLELFPERFGADWTTPRENSVLYVGTADGLGWSDAVGSLHGEWHDLHVGEWSGGFFDPRRRPLVTFLPEAGVELLRRVLLLVDSFEEVWEDM
jgi:hypothetical protein